MILQMLAEVRVDNDVRVGCVIALESQLLQWYAVIEFDLGLLVSQKTSDFFATRVRTFQG